MSGHPRNNLRHGGSYLHVERQTEDGWEVVATDASWDTRQLTLMYFHTQLAANGENVAVLVLLLFHPQLQLF